MPARAARAPRRAARGGGPAPSRARRGGPPDGSSAPARVKDASLLLIGADTVFRDGTVCNKVGTVALARAAAEAGIPAV
ncbi:MAG: initiation factor 2B, partial [Actinomycetota bacterium]|nr:initiation factor 2B [Actinomycetota bacterium]